MERSHGVAQPLDIDPSTGASDADGSVTPSVTVFHSLIERESAGIVSCVRLLGSCVVVGVLDLGKRLFLHGPRFMFISHKVRAEAVHCMGVGTKLRPCWRR